MKLKTVLKDAFVSSNTITKAKYRSETNIDNYVP